VFVANYTGPLFAAKSSFDRSGGGADEPDYAIYEVETFCRLLVKGNPKVVEPLFSENRCWYSERWLDLRRSRDIVINLTVAKQYFGFGKTCSRF
jgi:predicted nucleotidyltransferase